MKPLTIGGSPKFGCERCNVCIESMTLAVGLSAAAGTPFHGMVTILRSNGALHECTVSPPSSVAATAAMEQLPMPHAVDDSTNTTSMAAAAGAMAMTAVAQRAKQRPPSASSASDSDVISTQAFRTQLHPVTHRAAEDAMTRDDGAAMEMNGSLTSSEDPACSMDRAGTRSCRSVAVKEEITHAVEDALGTPARKRRRTSIPTSAAAALDPSMCAEPRGVKQRLLRDAQLATAVIIRQQCTPRRAAAVAAAERLKQGRRASAPKAEPGKAEATSDAAPLQHGMLQSTPQRTPRRAAAAAAEELKRSQDKAPSGVAQQPLASLSSRLCSPAQKSPSDLPAVLLSPAAKRAAAAQARIEAAKAKIAALKAAAAAVTSPARPSSAVNVGIAASTVAATALQGRQAGASIALGKQPPGLMGVKASPTTAWASK